MGFIVIFLTSQNIAKNTKNFRTYPPPPQKKKMLHVCFFWYVLGYNDLFFSKQVHINIFSSCPIEKLLISNCKLSGAGVILNKGL